MLYLDNDKNIEHEATLQLSKIYLHGDIQTIAEYDLIRTDDIRLYNKIYNIYNKDGKLKHTCNIYISRKGVYNVNMYIWYNVEVGYQGLACLSSDKEANEDARLKYEMKFNNL